VMNGPGLFVHPAAVTDAVTAAGIDTASLAFTAPLAVPAVIVTTAAPMISRRPLYMQSSLVVELSRLRFSKGNPLTGLLL